jgi:hypothetical protein
MGNFVFIDTKEKNYPEQIQGALSGSLSLALGSSGKTRISIENAGQKFLSSEVCKMDKTYEETKNNNVTQTE